ncbi:MAG TPA: cupin domain-containing protein [Planctomycetota bacterium]
MFRFQELIAPVSPGTFARRFWGRRVLHVPGPRARDVVTAEDIDGLLSRLKAGETAFVSSAENGTRPAASVVDRPLGHHDRIPPARLYAALRQGESIKLNFVEHRLPRVAAAVRAIEDFTQQPLNDATIFVTPPGGAALPHHFDDEHTFTIQLAGEKTWSFHRPARAGEPTPMPRSKAGRVLRSVRLRPGDVLYVPPRVIHAARSTRALSLSVGVGIRGLDVRDLLLGWLRRTIEALPREPLPCRWFDDRRRLKRELERSLERLAGAAGRSLDRALDDIHGRQLRNRQALREGALARAFAEGGRFVRPPEVECHVHRDRDGCVLSFPGAEPFRAPRSAWTALRFVAGRSTPFAPSELPGRGPRGLLESLVALGVLHRVP